MTQAHLKLAAKLSEKGIHLLQPVEKVAAVHNASKNFRQAEPQLTDSTLLEN